MDADALVLYKGTRADFAYDAQGNLLQKTISAGGRTRQWNMTYNAIGQVLTVDGPRTEVNDVTTYAYYDATDPCSGCRGNVKTTVNAAGHRPSFDAYDANGQPTRITDANGQHTWLYESNAIIRYLEELADFS